MQNNHPTPATSNPPNLDNPPGNPLKRYVFGAVFIPQKGIWLLEGTYPGLVVEAMTLPALLEKAAWAIKAIEQNAKKEADAEEKRLRNTQMHAH